jgi:hypothetical protein
VIGAVDTVRFTPSLSTLNPGSSEVCASDSGNDAVEQAILVQRVKSNVGKLKKRNSNRAENFG